MSWKLHIRWWIVALTAVGLLACGNPPRLEKGAGSAVWVADANQIDLSDLERLERAGVGEAFVEVGNLAWRLGEPSIGLRRLPELRHRRAITAVVKGVWPGSELSPKQLGETLAASSERLAEQLEGLGWVPVGIHFEVFPREGQLRPYAETLRALRRQLTGDLFLSATLEVPWLDEEEAEVLFDAVDFTAPLIYGFRPKLGGSPPSATLDEAMATVRRLDELGRPFLIGVGTLGILRRLDQNGEQIKEQTWASLGEIVSQPQFELSHGFTLEGMDHQVYTFEAKSEGKVGSWVVDPGDFVKVERLATHHVQALRRRVAELEPEHSLGFLYFRLPRAEEMLTLSVDNLLNALADEPPGPRLMAHLEELGGGRRYRLRLVSEGAEPTEVAMLSGNYVELTVAGGVFGGVEPGEFGRWELLRRGAGAKLERSFRNATVLRLHVPYLAGGEEVRSGAIEIRGRGAELAVGGSFILPDGRTLGVERASPEAATE